MSFDRGTWARDLLTRMGYPVNESNMTAILAWQYAEGGHFDNNAHFNPLNTSMDRPGADAINSHGVKAYGSYEQGMQATIATLELGYYDDVRAALQKGNSTHAVLAALVASPWGTTSLAFATVDRAKDAIDRHPGWLRPVRTPVDRPPGGPRRPGPPADDGSNESVIVYPREVDALVSLVTERLTDVSQADTVGREVWADLHLSAVVDPTDDSDPLPGVDRTRLREAASELGMSLDDNLGLPFVDRQLAKSRGFAQRFIDRIREIDGDGYRPRSRAEARRMLRALKDDLTPAGYAAMQAFLLGGLRKGRPPVSRPSAPHRARPERPRPHRPEGRPEGSRPARVKAMLDKAGSQVGYRERGNNYTKYGVWYGVPGSTNAPWCAMFVSWVFAQSGNKLPPLQDPKGFDYTNDAITELRAKGELHRKPHKGDVFIYNGHTGIVSDVNPNGTFDTIEGNAGPDTDRVVRGTRSPDDGKGYVFWSPIR